MNKEEYLRLAEEKWSELEALQAKGDFYTFEKRYSEIMQELNLAILQAKIGEVPKDHRKKKPSKQRSDKSK